MIDRIDHVVLTTRHEDACRHFYVEVLGMQHETFGAGRQSFVFGKNKINLHIAGAEFEPRADQPVPGSQDWCFIADRPLEAVMERLQEHGIDIIEGPVDKTGAAGPIRSVYVRDPDLNLIEISEYVVADS